MPEKDTPEKEKKGSKVQKLNASSYYDVRTGIEFQKIEDKRIGCFVAVAEVRDEALEFYREHPGFKLLDDVEYYDMLGIKPVDPNAKPATAPLENAPPSPDDNAKSSQRSQPSPSRSDNNELGASVPPVNELGASVPPVAVESPALRPKDPLADAPAPPNS